MANPVLNKHHGVSVPWSVYIGRGSKWGNPFPIGANGGDDRATVIAKHRVHLKNQIQEGVITREDLLALDNRSLVCFCAPAPCHGHTIARAVMWAKGEIGFEDI